MFRFNQPEIALVVLRDADEIRDAVQRALVTADADERPGLERAAAVIAEEHARTDAELRVRWARRTLADGGVDAQDGHVAAVRAMRLAVPGMSLLVANQLVKEATGKA
ncbi:hypothetical protein [Streptomyces sp. H27-D2]|uniref:hypothetical protein n=1 Tax=Streptomyces sp. H27-D2 TaxID=3046304 RepID=UPI002DB5B998|nr:hypothetical protein [Streptomyces sp. H27-D2]MEC4018885.1 hypothetical protein [Streptomyces sp. H27-D2]